MPTQEAKTVRKIVIKLIREQRLRVVHILHVYMWPTHKKNEDIKTARQMVHLSEKVSVSFRNNLLRPLHKGKPVKNAF